MLCKKFIFYFSFVKEKNGTIRLTEKNQKKATVDENFRLFVEVVYFEEKSLN